MDLKDHLEFSNVVWGCKSMFFYICVCIFKTFTDHPNKKPQKEGQFGP